MTYQTLDLGSNRWVVSVSALESCPKRGASKHLMEAFSIFDTDSGAETLVSAGVARRDQRA